MMEFSYTKPVDTEIDARGGEITRSEKYKNKDASVNDLMAAVTELESEGYDLKINILVKSPKE